MPSFRTRVSSVANTRISDISPWILLFSRHRIDNQWCISFCGARESLLNAQTYCIALRNEPFYRPKRTLLHAQTNPLRGWMCLFRNREITLWWCEWCVFNIFDVSIHANGWIIIRFPPFSFAILICPDFLLFNYVYLCTLKIYFRLFFALRCGYITFVEK